MKMFIEKFQTAEPREQKMMFFGGLTITVILFFAFIIFPLQEKVDNAKSNLEYKQSLYQWMQPKVKSLIALKSSKPTNLNQTKTSALIIVERELKQSALSGLPHTIEKKQNDEVQITFDSVPFDEVIRWLGGLSQSFQLQVQSMTVNRLAEEGMVGVNVVVSGN